MKYSLILFTTRLSVYKDRLWLTQQVTLFSHLYGTSGPIPRNARTHHDKVWHENWWIHYQLCRYYARVSLSHYTQQRTFSYSHNSKHLLMPPAIEVNNGPVNVWNCSVQENEHHLWHSFTFLVLSVAWKCPDISHLTICLTIQDHGTEVSHNMKVMLGDFSTINVKVYSLKLYSFVSLV